MNRLLPKAIDEGSPCRELSVYSRASQSPINGSIKTRMRTRARDAGTIHQRQVESMESLDVPCWMGGSGIFIFHFPIPLPLAEGIDLTWRCRFFRTNFVETVGTLIVRRRDYPFEYVAVFFHQIRKQLAGRRSLVLFRNYQELDAVRLQVRDEAFSIFGSVERIIELTSRNAGDHPHLGMVAENFERGISRVLLLQIFRDHLRPIRRGQESLKVQGLTLELKDAVQKHYQESRLRQDRGAAEDLLSRVG